ncbi:MAG: sulfotransferase [Anaerolineales bacterium]|jgi:hypothetical protein
MKPSQLELPISYKVANAVGKILLAAQLPLLRLDEKSVCDSAKKQTGLSDFGDPYYREGLLRLLESLEKDANLHPLGRFMTKDMITNYLVQRLRLVETRKKEPEIFNQPLTPPLIICGLARSGTTFLQRMLALDPKHRALPEWLLIRPFPDKSEDNSEPDPRMAKMEQALRFREPLLPGLDAKHYTRADTPEECIMALGLTFNSLIFGTLFPVFGYMDWYLEKSNNFQKYQEYGWLLQVFQSHEPQQRLILKAPAHTGNLEALTHAIPQAMVIQTHRDPVACVSSVCSLVYTFYCAVSNEIDIKLVTDQTLKLYEGWFRRSMSYRESHPDVVYDVYFDSLVSDPIGTVKDIYSHFGLPWTENYEADLKKFVQENPKDKHGKHQYTASDFRLDEKEIADRFQFYTKHFGL